MKTPKNSDKSLNDEDIKSLIGSDDVSVSVPVALDNAILNAAHDAVKQSSGQSAVASSPTSSPASLSKTSPVTSNRWNMGWPQGLSVAAVVVLSAVLVPLMINTSDTPTVDVTAESSVISADRDVASSASDELQQSKSNSVITAESVGAKSTGAINAREGAATRNRNTTSALTEQQPTVVASAPAVDSSADRVDYRESALTWVDEINRLVENKEIDQAREEYKLFFNRYPNHKSIPLFPDNIKE